jgi:hypothetical protein
VARIEDTTSNGSSVAICLSVVMGMRVYQTIVQQQSIPHYHRNMISEALPSRWSYSSFHVSCHSMSLYTCLTLISCSVLDSGLKHHVLADVTLSNLLVCMYCSPVCIPTPTDWKQKYAHIAGCRGGEVTIVEPNNNNNNNNNKQFIPCECCSQLAEFVYSSKLFCKLILL